MTQPPLCRGDLSLHDQEACTSDGAEEPYALVCIEVRAVRHRLDSFLMTVELQQRLGLQSKDLDR